MLKNTHKNDNRKLNDKGILNGVMKFFTVIIIVLIVGAVTLKVTSLNNISIEGNSHYSNEEMIDLLITKETDRNSILFYLTHKYGNNKDIPFIEKVDVKLTDRNSAQINVYEKVITGSIEYMDYYIYFDREGIVVETSDKQIDKVPIVSGLKFNRLILHQAIEVDKPDVFNTILNLTQLIYTYDIDVSIIHFTNQLEVILYSDNLRILLGKRPSYDEQIAQIPNLITSLESENGKKISEGGKKLVIDMKEFEEGQDKIIATPIE